MTEAVALEGVPTIEEALAIVVPRLRAQKAAYMQAYFGRPGVKAKRLAYLRAYNHRPYVKARRAAYRARPWVKARQRAYDQRRRTRP